MAAAYLWRKQATAAWLRANQAGLPTDAAGRTALIKRPGRKRITIEIVCADRLEAQKLAGVYGGTCERIPQNWRQRQCTPDSSKAIRIGRRLAIGSGRARDDVGKAVPWLVIPAEAAFGTGEHVTTAMTLRFLEERTRHWPRGWKLFDAGTGSGILALAGRVFAAGKVLALDNDPLAITTALRNARRNRIAGVHFQIGDATKIRSREKFDVVTANLYSELLTAALPSFRKILARSGHLILSGVLRRQERALRRALRKHCFAIEKVRRRGKWVALLCHRTRKVNRSPRAIRQNAI